MRQVGMLAVLLLALSATAAVPAATAETTTTVLTEDWPPFNYIEGGALKGFSYEIFRYLMKQLLVDYEIQSMPGFHGKQILDQGPRVIFFTMLRTPARESLYKWIGPLGEESIYFYKKKGSPLRIATLDDAKKVAMVSCRNTGLVYDFLTKAGFQNLDTTTNPAGIYLKVVSGRCDLAIGETPFGVPYWLRQSNVPIDSLEQTSVGILKSRFFIACSKDFPDSEIALWQGALDAMKASGEYDALYRKYYAPRP